MIHRHFHEAETVLAEAHREIPSEVWQVRPVSSQVIRMVSVAPNSAMTMPFFTELFIMG